MTKKTVIVNIVEVRNPDKDAQLVAENIALAIERRVAFRRAMKQAIQRATKSGVKGIKVSASGRLGGAEMARTEGYSEGNVPLQTLRADITMVSLKLTLLRKNWYKSLDMQRRSITN